jgi:NAD+ kinase
MKIALFGKQINENDIHSILHILEVAAELEIELVSEIRYLEQIKTFREDFELPVFSNTADLIHNHVNFVLSLGGDGTLLETLTFVKETAIPVIGINLGRLGFLASIPKERIREALTQLKKSQFSIEKRSIIELRSRENLFSPFHFALNDFTIHKRDTGAMIAVDTYLNGEFFCTYWADGLIVATPTGSTAYSLSCGGPVITPDTNSMVITPVAPHNLNIRPIVVADSTVVSFKVHGRGHNHLVSLDSRSEIIEYSMEMAVQKAPFYFNLVKLNSQNFINTLREKLTWGFDTRNQ